MANPESLTNLISSILAPLGYEVVCLELHTHRQKILRIYIDHLDPAQPPIGIEDCTKVSRALDQPLENLPEIDAIFHGTYDLEVSSPGIERILRLEKDYTRFQDKEARIHVFRPLTSEEIENPDYQQKNPKQKNFFGILKGLQNGKVVLDLPSSFKVKIPLNLISKANLEPRFELSSEKELKS